MFRNYLEVSVVLFLVYLDTFHTFDSRGEELFGEVNTYAWKYYF